jgi:metal-responsive CopG/Arc/MetJ family transcriptional regulator
VARRQVIVQLDDALLAELDRAAVTRKLSRSEILRRAARLYLDAAAEAEQERHMLEAYRRIPEDPTESEALTRLAVENWPEW